MSAIKVESSAIREIDYDEDTKTLKVTFNGGNVYEYMLVPKVLWDGLKAQAEAREGGDTGASVGKFFSSNIRNSYQGIKVS